MGSYLGGSTIINARRYKKKSKRSGAITKTCASKRRRKTSVNARTLERFASDVKKAVQRAKDEARSKQRRSTTLNMIKGNRVSHPTFGRGIIIAVQGNKVDVRFEKVGKLKVLEQFLASI